MDDAITMDPHYAYEQTHVMVHANTYDTLVEYRPPDLSRVYPRLAEEWSISDDGSMYTFRLRPGVRFASGNLVTAEDVRFSWMRLINLKGNPSFYGDVIDKVEVPDDSTVRVTLKKPSPAFLNIIAGPSMSILDSRVVKAQGGTDAPDADQIDKAKDWLDQNSAGSGPFILVGWIPKAEIVLEANPNYWRGTPELDRVIIKHVTDASTQLQLLRRGDADIVHTLDIDLVDQVLSDPNLTLVTGQTLNVIYLAMSPDPGLGGPLADRRVRQAIAYALDYDRIIQDLLGGHAVRAPSVIPLGIMGVDPTKRRDRDLDRARALLRGGYESGKLELELAYGAEPGALRETIAAKIKADLEEVGIVVNLRPMQLSMYLSEMRSQRLSFALGIWTPDYVDPTMWTDYFSYPDRGVAYRLKYDSTEAARWADVVATELDYSQRETAVRNLIQIWMDEVPFTMVYQPQQLVALSADVKGFVYDPTVFVNLFKLSK